MAPIAKENEALAGNPSSGTANKPATEAVRSQPVALEIPVTVNGARTIEGSDKREPFSESTQTVLVFTNGAVIRLASPLAPGQLVFLTNEKTKKEVVCQVVKSKNYRTVTGYVELEFTEPAPGFWGMRFPAVAGPASTANIPVAPRPTANVAAPSTSTVPAPPKVMPPAAPVTSKSISPEVAAPMPSAHAMPAAPSSAVPVAPPSVLPSKTISAIPASDASSLWGDAPVQNAAKPSTTEPIPYTVKPDGLAHKSKDFSNEIAAMFSVPQAPSEPKFQTKVPAPVQIAPPSPVVPPAPVAPPTVVASEALPAKSSATSTDELKQQAARLQEQLSAMLFTEAPPTSTTVAPVAPVDERPKADKISDKVLQLTSADLTSAPAVPPAIAKATPPVIKPAKSSLDAEEVQIPAWLAPLARNAETSVSEEAITSETRAAVQSETSATEKIGVFPATTASDSSEREQPAIFGGQLLTDSTTPAETATSSGSKKGLFIGIAAAALLAVCGAAWYVKQPGNVLTGWSAGKQVASHNTNFESVPALGSGSANSETTPLSARSTAPAFGTAPASQPSSVAPASASFSPSSAITKNNTTAPRPVEPAFELAQPQPKKPTLGDVRLATPVVKGSAKSVDVAEGEPNMLDSQAVPNAESLAGLTAGHSKGPAAPTPIGGDVKAAKLIKSVAPIYPTLARSQRISGNVQIDALIDEYGNVTTMKVLSGSPILHQSALAAVKQWKYEPAVLDGKPTQMHLTVTVQFRTQ